MKAAIRAGLIRYDEDGPERKALGTLELVGGQPIG